MSFGIIVITLACYAGAVYLSWRERQPAYVLCLVGGHIGALLSPLWPLLYGFRYRAEFDVLATLLDQPLLLPIVLAGAWFYTLPALLVFGLYVQRWWFPGYISGLLTVLLFLFYHLVAQSIGLRLGAWQYTPLDEPPVVPPALPAALLAALITAAVLYLLLMTRRQALVAQAVTLLLGPLALGLLVHGVLGAPLWVPELLQAPPWARLLGLAGAGVLAIWAVQLVATAIGSVPPLRREIRSSALIDRSLP